MSKPKKTKRNKKSGIITASSIIKGLVCALKCIDHKSTIDFKPAPDAYINSMCLECHSECFAGNDTKTDDIDESVCNYEVITAHALARMLLAGRDLPVYRYPTYDPNYEAGVLVPLSDVSTIIPVDENDEEFSDEVVVIDTLIKAIKPSTKLNTKTKRLLV